MSAQCEVAIKQSAGAPMSVFERFLTVWVFLCIVAGIALGQFLPGVFQAIGRMEFAQVNLPVGLLIWVMIIPMLVKVDFSALGEVRQHVRGIGVTLLVNWLVNGQPISFRQLEIYHDINAGILAGISPLFVLNFKGSKGVDNPDRVGLFGMRHLLIDK